MKQLYRMIATGTVAIPKFKDGENVIILPMSAAERISNYVVLLGNI